MTIVKLMFLKKQEQLLLNTKYKCSYLRKGLLQDIEKECLSLSFEISSIGKLLRFWEPLCLGRPPKDILIPKSPREPVHFSATKLLPLLLLFIFVEGDTNIKKQMAISPSSLILLRTAVIVSAAVYKA